MTKKIKIAVAVDSKGNYNAHAWGGPNYGRDVEETDWADSAFEGLVWVEAELPLPEDSTTVDGVAGPLKLSNNSPTNP